MKKITIYKLNGNGKQSKIAECRLDGKQVNCEGDSEFVKSIKEEGIENIKKGSLDKLYPKDGKEFMENLLLQFTSPYLVAKITD